MDGERCLWGHVGSVSSHLIPCVDQCIPVIAYIDCQTLTHIAGLPVLSYKGDYLARIKA